MNQFLPVFKALERDIRYVTVGGIATVLNGFPRLTGDIDIVLDLSNEDNVIFALKSLHNIGMRPRMPVDLFDFTKNEIRKSWIAEKSMKVFSLHSPMLPLIEVDLFVEEPLPFEDLWKNSQIFQIEDIKIRAVSIDDLITLKKMAGRPKDLEDIANLSFIKANK